MDDPPSASRSPSTAERDPTAREFAEALSQLDASMVRMHQLSALDPALVAKLPSIKRCVQRGQELDAFSRQLEEATAAARMQPRSGRFEASLADRIEALASLTLDTTARAVATVSAALAGDAHAQSVLEKRLIFIGALDAARADLAKAILLLGRYVDWTEQQPLPNYHELLDRLCGALDVPGSPTFDEALEHVKARLGR